MKMKRQCKIRERDMKMHHARKNREAKFIKSNFDGKNEGKKLQLKCSRNFTWL